MKRLEIVTSGNLVHRRESGSPSALCGFQPLYKRLRWMMYGNRADVPKGFKDCEQCVAAMPERR